MNNREMSATKFTLELEKELKKVNSIIEKAG